MSNSTQLTAFVSELLQPMGHLSCHPFFGGTAYRSGPHQFAILVKNTLYFYVSDDTRTQYQQAGGRAFSYLSARGRVNVKKYYSVPEHLFDEPEQFTRWAQQALAAATKMAAPMTAH